MSQEIAVSRYENLLLGKNPHFYLSGDAKDKERDALALFQYIIRDLLNWSPAVAMDNISPDIANKMHIDKLTSYIVLPVGMSRKEDLDYIVHMAFPKETKYDVEKRTIQCYKALMQDRSLKFPKNFFNKNSEGMYHARILLAFAISSFLPLRAGDTDMLFRIFSDLTEANKLLKEWRLSAPCKTLYNKSPLKYLYDTVEHTQEVEFLYNNYKFINVFNKISKEMPIA